MDDVAAVGLVAIEDALESGRADIASVALVVGASAANFGSPLQEVLDQLERAYAKTGDLPAYDVVRAITTAWTDASLVHQHQVSCEDPLTALSSLPHLRSRLGDLYRGAERDGTSVGDAYALVVVELPRVTSANPLDGALAMLEVGEALRTVYNGDETIAQVSARRAVALVELERTDRVSLELLHILVRHLYDTAAEPRLWVESPPRAAAGIARMLAELAR